MKASMMPVIRVTDRTWKRMQRHAKPFVHKPEDVLVMALDALDEKAGFKPLPNPEVAMGLPIRRTRKLPQKSFRNPLLKTLLEMGGRAHASEIKGAIEPKVAPMLSDVDYKTVSTGDPRWWNAICWERAALVRDGLFSQDSPRGVWELTEKGKLASLEL